jgi:hypothetical protein
MVLTKEELVASLQKEVRIFVHLAGKIDKSKLDYRPTPKQRSTLELLQYMAIMGPTQIAVLKAGVFTKPAMMEAWSSAEAASKTMSFEQAMAAIEKQAAEFDRMFNEWTEADFREELDKTRGFLLVNIVLSGFAAYRMQLFCYLKSCGREELNTLNLWMGADGSMGAS